MGMNRTTRRLTAWLACFAVLLATLAPSISHALTATQGSSGWLEICTADGSKYVEVDAANVPSAPPAKNLVHHLEHCPFCMTHDGGFGPPPSATNMVPALLVSATHPDLFYLAPHPLFAWVVAQPRAPPLVS